MSTSIGQPLTGPSRLCARLGVLAAFMVLWASVTALLLVPRYSRPVAVADVGTTAPDFQLADTQGRTISLAGCRGQAVVLFFCASSLTANTDYTPRVEKLAREYGEDSRVQFLAIAAGASSLDRSIPTLLDDRGSVSAHYSAYPKPFVVVIDSRGLVSYRGPFDDNHDTAFVTQNFCADALRNVLGAPIDPIASLRR